MVHKSVYSRVIKKLLVYFVMNLSSLLFVINAAVAVGTSSFPEIAGYTVQKGDCGYPVCDTVQPGPTPGGNLTIFAQVVFVYPFSDGYDVHIFIAVVGMQFHAWV